MNARSIAFILCLAAATLSAHADTITLITSAPANTNDSLSFLQLGSDGTALNSGFSATTNNGIGVTGTFSSSPLTLVQTCDQSENNCFDALPSSGGSLGVVGTPITFTFSAPVFAIGTTVENLDSYLDSKNQNAGFALSNGTATLSLYNGATLLGTVTQSEVLQTQEYLGVVDTSGANITSAVLSFYSPVPKGDTLVQAFQLDSLDLVDNPAASNVAATPEPSSLALLGTGVLGVSGVLRRRFAKSA